MFCVTNSVFKVKQMVAVPGATQVDPPHQEVVTQAGHPEVVMDIHPEDHQEEELMDINDNKRYCQVC